MPTATRVRTASAASRDVIRDIHDLDERERAAAYRRWVELSKLVAPLRPQERARRPEREDD